MSYARFSPTSDVYIYAHYLGFIECCACILGDTTELHSLDEVTTHIDAHVAAGHKVHPALLDPETYDVTDFEPEAIA